MVPTDSPCIAWQPDADGWRRPDALRALRRLTDNQHPVPPLLDGRPVAAVASVRFGDPARDRRSADYWDAAPAPRTRVTVGRFDVILFEDGSGLAGLEDGTDRVVLPSRPFVGTPDALALERLWKPAPRVSTTRSTTWEEGKDFAPDSCRLLLPIVGEHIPSHPGAKKEWTGFCAHLRDLFPGLPDTVRIYGAWAGGGLRCAFPSPHTPNGFHEPPDGLLAGLEAQARIVFPGLMGFCQRWNPSTDIGQDPREQAFALAVGTKGGHTLSAHERLERLGKLLSFSQTHR